MIKRQLENEKQWFAFASNSYRKLKLNCKIAKIFLVFKNDILWKHATPIYFQVPS